MESTAYIHILTYYIFFDILSADMVGCVTLKINYTVSKCQRQHVCSLTW